MIGPLCTAIGRRFKARVSKSRKIAPQKSRKIISQIIAKLWPWELFSISVPTSNRPITRLSGLAPAGWPIARLTMLRSSATEESAMLNGITEPSQQAYRNFQRHVDRLCLLIVASDCSDREIDIERLHLRVQAATLFPEKMPLYDMVYESRFRRIRQQFRERPRR